MKKELEDKLFEKHKLLFPNARNVKKSENLMYYGFDCGDGWYNILDNLFTDLEKLMINNIPIIIFQVKEKFGSLVVHIDDVPDCISKQANDLVTIACRLSIYICERCGAKGERRTDRVRVATLCDKCNEEN